MVSNMSTSYKITPEQLANYREHLRHSNLTLEKRDQWISALYNIMGSLKDVCWGLDPSSLSLSESFRIHSQNEFLNDKVSPFRSTDKAASSTQRLTERSCEQEGPSP